MSDSHTRVASVFAEALARQTPDERAAYLDAACGDDAELRARVEALLRARDQAGSFLEKPAAEFVATDVPGDPQRAADELDDEAVLKFLTPSDDSDCLGTIGPYRISDIIGRGGMGIVLKGVDPKLNRVVAVKLLAPELASNASARKRFLREGQATAAISHDHVVTIFGIDDAAPLPFIAMEYIAGPSLQQRIDERGALELKEILRIGKQAAAGLAAAHAEGLVHRDIKPSNLLLENGVERVKITDFGLARAVDDVRITKPGTVTGTPEYMSPEQARSEPVDHRSDLFSLGCVLFAMCTGRPPFRAENTASIIRRICDDQPQSIREINPDIPDWLQKFIERLLAKDPDQRFQSASEVSDLLGRYLAHVQRPSSNPVPPEFEPLPSSSGPTSRRGGRLVAAACALLIGLLGVGFTEATGITQITPTIIEIFRNDGTLIVQVDDPDIQVLVDGEELVITGAGAQEFRLKPGEHQFQAIRDGEPVQQRLVRITRGGEEVVRVEFEPSADSLPTPERVGITVRKVWEGTIDVGGQPSPDGRFLSFADWKSGNLAIRDLRTGETRSLTENDDYAHGLPGNSCFSPDGQQLAFNWYDEEREQYDLRIIGVDGSGERVIYQDAAQSFTWVADWSSDGRFILGTLAGNGSRELVTVSVDDGTLRVLKSLDPEKRGGRSFARFSPDARYVAFDRPPDGSSNARDVFVLDLDSGVETVLIEHPADDGLMGWAPDGSGVLFRSDRRGTNDVWFVPVANGTSTGDPVLVRADLGPLTSLMGFTQDGSYYYSASLTRMNVYVGDLDLERGEVSNRRLATHLYQDTTHLPDWSPDGTQLAFISERARAGTRLCIQTLETGAEREFPLRLDRALNVRWSPDGKQILVGGFLKNARQGYIIDVETGEATEFPVHRGTGDVDSHWTPDGSGFYFRNPNGGLACPILRRDAASDEETEIYTGESYIRDLAVSRASGDIAFAEGADAYNIRVLDGDSGEVRELTTIHSPDWIAARPGESLEFTPDGRNLLFVKILGDKRELELRELWSVPVEGGQPQRLDLAMPWLRHPRVHPDGRQIAFTAGVKQQIDVWVMQNFLPGAGSTLVSQSDSQSSTDAQPAAGIVARQVWAPALDTEGGPSSNGRLLSYVDWKTGNLAVRDLITGENRQVSTDGGWDGYDVYPEYAVFSPDGTQLACCWYDGEQRTFDLRIVNLDGSPPRVLYQSEDVDYFYPNDWSDDGRFILTLLSKKGAPDEIALISTADGSATTVQRLDGDWPLRMSLSPDGRYVVHDATRDEDSGTRNVSLLAADGSREVLLVESEANNLYPVWCPDGEHVLFFSDRTGSMSAWLIKVVDGAPVGKPWLVQENIGEPWPMGITRDGVLYYSKQTDAQDIFITTLNPGSGEATGTPRPVNRHRPGSKTDPRWSPDGEWMSYLWHGPLETDQQRSTIVVRSVATGQEREVLVGGRRIDGVAWSPDGRQLAARWLDNTNTWHVGVVDVQSGARTSLEQFKDPTRPLPPRWLPDGNSLLFNVGEEGDSVVRQGDWRRFDLKTQESTVLTGIPRSDAGGIRFVDEKTVIYGARAQQDGTQPARTSARQITIWRLNLESGEREKVVTSRGYTRESPDGRELAFVVPGEAPAIGIVPIAGGEPRMVYQFPAGSPHPSLGRWTADGQTLFFSAPENDTEQLPRKFALWRLSTAGDSPPQRVLEFEQQRRDQRFIVSPDGSRIAFTAGENKYEVWTLENFLPP